MELKSKTVQDINRVALLFLLYGLWKIYIIVYSVYMFYLHVDAIFVAMTFLNVILLLISLLFYIFLRRKSEIWRVIAIGFISTNMMLSLHNIGSTFQVLLFDMQNLPFRFWIASMFHWFFYIYAICILFRRDVRIAFEYHKHHEEIAYATTNGDD